MDHETRISLDELKMEIRNIRNKMHRFVDRDEIGRVNSELMNIQMSFATLSFAEELNSRINHLSERLDKIEEKIKY